MLIFGFGPGKSEDLGEVIEVTCPFCHNDVFLRHARSKKAVRLYFVPVVPYGTDDYLVCPTCTRGLQLTKEQQPLVADMQAATESYRSGRLDASVYENQVEAFWRGLGIRPIAPHLDATSPPQILDAREAVDAGARSWVDQLADLDRLRQEGVVSEEQYNAAKRRVIGDE